MRNLKSINSRTRKLNTITDNLTILYTNIYPLPNKIHELQQYANSLENSPDIIALTEIKHKNKWHVDISELNIDGYRLFNNDLQSCNRGIIVYVKDNETKMHPYP